jgi:Tol biopolymer transport system component
MISSRTQLAAWIAAALLASPSLAQSTSNASLGSNGTTANGRSWLNPQSSAVTPDGRFVVFQSLASDLMNGDTAGLTDVFVRDLTNGQLERISVTGAGGFEPNGTSQHGAISDDGRFVAFESEAQNLVPGDSNFSRDIFLRDRQIGVTTIISVSTGGAFGNAASSQPAISADGSFIAFASAATNLVANDPNGQVDVFLRNLTLGTTRLVSLATGGANGVSDQPAISADGRFVAFRSTASNLVPVDLLGFADIFVRDMTGPTLELVSVNTAGAQGDGNSSQPSLSADGSRLVFTSAATNLAPIGPAALNVFLRDRTAGATALVNAGPNGPSNALADRGRISRNGAYASFLSPATNLAGGHSGSVVDAFVVKFASGEVQRASVPTAPQPSELSSAVLENGGVSDNGRFAPFSTAANNVIAGETGALEDVYVRDLQRDWYIDADADNFGDVTSIVLDSFPPVGYIGVGGDCDDTDPAVNPGAPEICNGIDDNCDNFVDEIAWQNYCTAAVSQNGCTPHVTATGFPSASATSGFVLEMTGVDGLRPCSIVYGLTPTGVSWGFGSASVRCVSFPWSRVTTFGSGGTGGQCDGAFSLDWLAFMAANPGAQGQPIGAGQTFYAQGWYRDPGAAKNSNLADAVQFTLCP